MTAAPFCTPSTWTKRFASVNLTQSCSNSGKKLDSCCRTKKLSFEEAKRRPGREKVQPGLQGAEFLSAG